MRNIWNILNEEQRKELLQKIYNNNFFDYLCDKDFDNLIFGVKRRLEILGKVLNI